MELPTLGKQCAQSNCKQLDFLPLTCKCGKLFCSEHFNAHVQTCATFIDHQVEPKKFESPYKCSHDECKETSLVPIICPRCSKNFCVKHRHLTECFDKDPETRAAEIAKVIAPVRQFTEAKIAVDKQIENNLNKARKKGKNNLANKVQLMKIKNRAKGLNTIPTDDRIYFNVKSAGSIDCKAVFVSKTWSLGRAIDAIADECQLKNENNKIGGRKLRLFKEENREHLSADLSDLLQTLVMNNVIVDGESLLIDYV